MGRVAAGVAASAAAEYGSAEAAQQRIGLSNPHQGAQPDEPGTRPAHVAGLSRLNVKIPARVGASWRHSKALKAPLGSSQP